MQRLIESVPNFSEGRSKAVIDEIAGAIEAVPGATLLHVEMGIDTNRTVITFVGEPEPVTEAAFQSISRAAALIDMRRHQGVHPRIGATDVCPIIPVRGISIAECLPLAEALGKRVGDALGIPVYLYAASARVPGRARLPDIRRGGYERLEERMKDPAFRPDFGPARFNPGAGATVIGVRDFLLAYNVNLKTPDRRLAAAIAAAIRKPARLKGCQAAGWYIDAYGLAQVTMNLLDFRAAGLHTAFEAVKEEAERLGLRVTGSEIVGLIPRQAILDAGVYYLRNMGKNAGIPEEEIIQTAILSLGLCDVAPFVPDEKIIEYALDRRGYEASDRFSVSAISDA
jgi:glutamate formiminotransferase/formiminotetrahydrofolate cyclodeaminase